ncbi:MAG: ABC transporter permease [Planctomycetota bacterium]|nr:ABC transporter permease [Planctomycetota bacterium]
MTFLNTIRIALRALAKNKLRAGLTILGVVIGIAAVTAMVSIGLSASELVQGEFRNLGTNVIILSPGNRRGARSAQIPSLTAADVQAVSRECPSALAATPLIGASAQVISGNNNWRPKELFGVGADYMLVRNGQMRIGAFFGEGDINNSNKVCVLGDTVVKKLFQTANPIGQSVRIKNIPFEIVGVLASKGADIVGNDQDDVVLMPYTTVRKRLQGSSFDNVDVAMISARSSELMGQAEQEIKALMMDRHRISLGQQPDFEVRNTTEIAGAFSIVTGTMTAMLASIAGISLVVGGVGIMNIMLVSVTERTREIGIRMAVGARPRDILMQFLVESMVLSLIGGAIGVLLGVLGSVSLTLGINALSSGRDWPIVVSQTAAIVSLVFSAAVGIGFGFYPAWRASRLDPIDALRYE